MKSEPSGQSDLSSGFEAHMKVSRKKQLNDPKAWHNLFFRHITAQIDETPYGVLFDEHTGRPNAPVRQLVAMMILKEGHGWSDAGLFEHGRFNLLVMRFGLPAIVLKFVGRGGSFPFVVGRPRGEDLVVAVGLRPGHCLSEEGRATGQGLQREPDRNLQRRGL